MVKTELESLLEAGCALIVGTVAVDGSPDATRGWGVRIESEDRLRVLVGVEAATSLDNLRATGAVAITATDLATNTSLQLKGHSDSVDGATDDDRSCAAQFIANLSKVAREIVGTPEELLGRLAPVDVVAFEMMVQERFDQTPGPAAGRSLAGAPS